MSEISIGIGNRIRNFRKKRKITLDDLAKRILKCKATVSKYEKGEIVIDIVTLYDIADALHVHVEQLLYCRPERAPISSKEKIPAFFIGLSQFYSYAYDGRTNQLSKIVVDVLSETDDFKYKIMMYMNYSNFSSYQNCENIYWGYMEHYDSITNIFITNQDTNMEKPSIVIPASFLDSNTKWGLYFGISTRPLMPIAIKMLFSKTLLKIDEELIRNLKVSKEDIRLLKLFNMYSVL